MGALFYYLLVKPVSLLPMRALHGLSSMLYYVLYRLAGYRKKVVRANLVNSFPDKTPAEIEDIMRRFYRYFCDFMMESIKVFSISEREAVARTRFKNPEVLERFHRQGRDVVVALGHYNNWEMAALGFAPQTAYLPVAVYQPLRNAFFNKKVMESRSRFGLVLVPKSENKTYFSNRPDQPIAIIFAADQSPTYNKKVYWTTFLNQETAVAFGSEKYAVEFDAPVVFTRINRVGRGCYEVEFIPITENPATTSHGEITEAHTRLLEEQILEDPAYWLWTHKRWKRKRTPSEAV